MAHVLLHRKPVFVEFERRRELAFNLNTEILIRDVLGPNSSLWETVGEVKDEVTGEMRRTLNVNLNNLRVYLWAALQEDAERHSENLTLREAGALLSRRKWVTEAVYAIAEALKQYYGDDPQGEASAPAASA
jgi:hypothetical protein